MADVELVVKMLETAGGKCPFAEWYGSIRDTATRARIRARITRLQAGNFGDCKSVGDGVNELRIDFGPGYRVYFGRSGQRLVVLLFGGEKRSQQKDINAAKALWKEYENAAERFRRDFPG